ncbi:SDR family NAD(P)-dependent oxidoreductase [Gloeocapsopsis dulcis]|uniref:Short-chain dehydrogenase n=1 Tax=Gloeocapsopsis dulcis AAB1 = 1H9 TaxID=1433147 RepID=A0A6N8FUN0_9CHRO|nr:SDR family oxidoreductase [Gloeocapsopsis dulcis]MUL36840.1 short-chain dehydrogenase [Gloeocapsopsis dulcis AAB1 = 1H9]WNN88553.1 SDR family NAD(P)-dependent oxidoreductase [Gloeocapsopsis dulcis]
MAEDRGKKRVALVTGSTSGIGLAIAKRLAEDGYAVSFHSKSSVLVGQSLADAHPDSSYFQADLSAQSQSRNLITEVLSYHGRLDVLVNNAGISATIPHTSLKEASAEIWRNLYEVNVIAPWTLIAEAEIALRQSSSLACPSCILNISSHAGIRPKGASIPYSASKAALNHMTKLLAVSLAPQIRVNVIAPGLVESPMSKNWTAARNLWKERSPMGRGAQPEEIAQVASMLIASHYVTGEILISDGGLNLT